jgi:hypothetical protein
MDVEPHSGRPTDRSPDSKYKICTLLLPRVMLPVRDGKENKGYAREVKWSSVLRKTVGRDGLAMSTADVMRIHNVPKRFTEYWTEKERNAAFHAGALGGARRFLLTDAQQTAAENLLWLHVAADPRHNMTELARMLRNQGFPVNRR